MLCGSALCLLPCCRIALPSSWLPPQPCAEPQCCLDPAGISLCIHTCTAFLLLILPLSTAGTASHDPAVLKHNSKQKKRKTLKIKLLETRWCYPHACWWNRRHSRMGKGVNAAFRMGKSWAMSQLKLTALIHTAHCLSSCLALFSSRKGPEKLSLDKHST